MNPANALRAPRILRSVVWLLLAAPTLVIATPRPAADTAASSPMIECPEGTRLFNAGDLEAAKAAFIACAEADPASVEILLALAAIYLSSNQPLDALQWTSRAVELAPESVDALHRHGQALSGTGDSEGARKVWEQGLHISNMHPGLLGDLALLQLREGNEQGAYGLLTQLVRTGMATAKTHKTLSQLASKRGLWHQALFHWQGFLEAKETWVGEDLHRASELAIMAQDTSFAVLVARKAVEIDDSPTSYAALGQACFASKRLPEARDYLEIALAGDPSAAATRFNLANTLQLLGDLEGAESQFRHYVAQVPDDPLGFFNFATQLQQRGKLDEALLQAEQACNLDADFADAFVLKANLLESLGDDAQALETVIYLQTLGSLDEGSLAAWRSAIEGRISGSRSHLDGGQVQLLHLLTPDREAIDFIESQLKAGTDFSELVVRFSIGPTAATGGAIGWVIPDDMAEELARVIRDLEVQEISPPVESGGLIHMFKRLR